MSIIAIFVVVEIIPIIFVIDKSFIDLYVGSQRDEELKESLLSSEPTETTNSLLSRDRYYLPSSSAGVSYSKYLPNATETLVINNPNTTSSEKQSSYQPSQPSYSTKLSTLLKQVD